MDGAFACAVYFWARVAHVIVYALGLPVFRTLAFTVGFLAQAVLALAIFKIRLKTGSPTRAGLKSPGSAGAFCHMRAAPIGPGRLRRLRDLAGHKFIVSAKPSISRMFCTAAPEAPLPRLSRRATRTA